MIRWAITEEKDKIRIRKFSFRRFEEDQIEYILFITIIINILIFFINRDDKYI
jgi:hypothetical protein